MKIDLYNGDCLHIMKDIPTNSIDSIVTDPPYGLSQHDKSDIENALTAWLSGQEYTHNKAGFMNKTWDSFVPSPSVWKECFRVLKPGGHILCFAGTRTQDLMSISLRLAGFEKRDVIMNLYSQNDKLKDLYGSLDSEQQKMFAEAFSDDAGVLYAYGSGLPKGLDISKAIDKIKGAEREVVGYVDSRGMYDGIIRKSKALNDKWRSMEDRVDVVDLSKATMTVASTIEAKQWEGWKTALKPAYEPCLLFRKPVVGTVAENVLEYGVGGLNIDGCRVSIDKNIDSDQLRTMNTRDNDGRGMPTTVSGDTPQVFGEDGRFPANLTHDGSDDVGGMFPDVKTGDVKSYISKNTKGYAGGWGKLRDYNRQGDSGSASRFFYCSKAGKKDRDEGLDGFDVNSASGKYGSEKAPSKNNHPTVKPTNLMRYLVRMVTPPNGTCLDPFMGSGSTGKACALEGVNFVGIELNIDYFDIAKARIDYANKDKDSHFTLEDL